MKENIVELKQKMEFQAERAVDRVRGRQRILHELQPHFQRQIDWKALATDKDFLHR